jgi:hypothetical protein
MCSLSRWAASGIVEPTGTGMFAAERDRMVTFFLEAGVPT